MSEAATFLDAPAPDPTSADALEPLAREAWTLETPNGRPNRFDWQWDKAALLVDGLLVRVARGRGALDVALGDGLATLAVGDRTLRLGYQSVGDYALQRLGVAASTAEKMARLARALRERPFLRAAVWSGDLTARKAEVIVPVARGDAERFWVERARRSTVRALEEAVAGEAGTPPEDTWSRIAVTADPEIQARWREALALAGKVMGQGAPVWQRVEAICAEFLADFPEPEEPRCGAGPSPLRPATWGSPDGAVAGLDRSQVQSLREAKAWLEAEYHEWDFLERIPPVPVPGRPTPSDLPADPFDLDVELRRLASLRARWDEVLGHLALLMKMWGFWRDMQFAKFSQYAAERLGLSARTVEQRIALERRLYDLPQLRAALRAGRVSYEQARLIARRATERTADEWIAKAAATTCVALTREVRTAEEAQMCADGRLGMQLPSRVADLLQAAFRAAQEAAGRPLDAEFCLFWLAEHFIAAYPALNKKRRRRSVIERDGGWCQVPGCSRPAGHEHHIVFRSAGGGDEEENKTPPCPAHHLHAIHLGWVRVTGRAPDALRWELGVRSGKPPLEVWTTGPTGPQRDATGSTAP
jgi:hypothetical protein